MESSGKLTHHIRDNVKNAVYCSSLVILGKLWDLTHIMNILLLSDIMRLRMCVERLRMCVEWVIQVNNVCSMNQATVHCSVVVDICSQY